MSARDGAGLRTIGIFAHIDAGKTSLTERLLFATGRIRAAGAVDEGTTSTDFLAVERERGITVKAAAIRLDWLGREGPVRVNLVDTPGHVDFGGEVDRSLRALDGAVLLLCAVAGVQSRTEQIHRAATGRGLPRLVFVNKMDRRGASFSRTVEDYKATLDPGALPIQLPLGECEAFHGVVDLVEYVARDFSTATLITGQGARPQALPVPPDIATAAREARDRLVLALAEGRGGGTGDPGLLEDYVAGKWPDPGRLRAALRRAVLAGTLTPVLCGSAFMEGAAALLLDAVAELLPSPEEAALPPASPAPGGGAGTGGTGTVTDEGAGTVIERGPGAPLAAQVFKSTADPQFGRLSWTRIWAGKIAPGDRVLDARAGRTLRVIALFGIQADRLEKLESADAGEIVALALGAPQGTGKLKGEPVATGSSGIGASGATICDPARPLLFEPIVFAEPVVSAALEPRSRADLDGLHASLPRLLEEDPTLRLEDDAETGRLALAGSGELHLEVAVERLKREFGLAVRLGRPRVAFREALRKGAAVREAFDRSMAGERVRGFVALKLASLSRGSGSRVDIAPGLRIAPALRAALERGVHAGLSAGPAAGYPVVDAAVLVTSLEVPPGRLGEAAAEMGVAMALGRGLGEAGTLLLEPMMRAEISLSGEFLGAGAAAVTGREGRVEAIEEEGEGKLILAVMPLRRLFGFTAELRSATGGRASHAARFLRYETAPADALARPGV